MSGGLLSLMPSLPLDSPAAADRLQLIATIGPSSAHLIEDLARAGATAFRLNASHLDRAALAALLSRVRDRCPDAEAVVDLQGAKMRLGISRARAISAGDLARFALDRRRGLLLPHPDLYRQVRPRDTLSVDDGRVRFEVIQVEVSSLTARALTDGRLLPRKGVNVEQHPIELTSLTERDREACAVAAAAGVLSFACSFMTDGREAAWLREQVPGCRVAGKVERREAIDNLATIGRHVEAIWICRGDLGAQLGPARLARFVGGFNPRGLPLPVLMAGQVLEHLTAHDEPTRSEVCHLHDLVARGFAGVVLSDETAIGRNPVQAVATAAELLEAFRP